MTTTYASLCTGLGQLDWAVEAAFGCTLAWYAETDKDACAVLARRYAGVPNLGDLTAVDWSDVEPVDLVCAGFPCQPFSVAGKQKGFDDDRYLWPHIADALRVLRPRLVVLENVRPTEPRRWSEPVAPRFPWGRYSEAIIRHERAFGRPAPWPLVEGTRSLSGDFCAWMMDVEEGALDGISNTAKKRLCGNAVVARQAEAALRMLVAR